MTANQGVVGYLVVLQYHDYKNVDKGRWHLGGQYILTPKAYSMYNIIEELNGAWLYSST